MQIIKVKYLISQKTHPKGTNLLLVMLLIIIDIIAFGLASLFHLESI